MTSPIDKSLDVYPAPGGRLIADVRFRNVADFDVYVLKEPPSVFVECDGTEIGELGPSEKRTELTIDDYLRLPPAGKLEARLDLTDRYEWRPGTHTYEASISGNYTDPVDGRSWKAPRIVARFSWNK